MFARILEQDETTIPTAHVQIASSENMLLFAAIQGLSITDSSSIKRSQVLRTNVLTKVGTKS